MRTQLFIAVLFALFCWLGWLNVYGHIAMFFIFISCVGLVYPNAAVLCLSPFDKNAGSAAGLLGVLQISIGAMGATLFSQISLPPNVAASLVFVLTSFIAVTIFQVAKVKAR